MEYLYHFWELHFGSAVVFAFKNNVNIKIQKIFLGFAAGVMIAASIWSLIMPSIEMANNQGKIGWLPATIGILLGSFFLLITDIFAEKFNLKDIKVSERTKKTRMLAFAITLHNIPEGYVLIRMF